MNLLIYALGISFHLEIKLPVKMDTFTTQIMMPAAEPHRKPMLLRDTPHRPVIYMMPMQPMNRMTDKTLFLFLYHAFHNASILFNSSGGSVSIPRSLHSLTVPSIKSLISFVS